MPPENISPLDAYQQMYGPVEGIPDSGRVIARPTPILAIWPDLRQPRRAMPVAVRAGWNGDPEGVLNMLTTWLKLVEGRLGAGLAVERVIQGYGDEIEIAKSDDPVIDDYVSLVKLAASIKQDGLVHPIHCGAEGEQRWRIESGERRWLAYHLLNFYLGNYDKIPMVEKKKVDVWAQAAENGSRAPLNAIGMARQLALLIMAMYEGDRDVEFGDYEAMILPGECDRRYYAQVANGNAYPIKRGMGDRVLAVTGLKSKHQISQYRALLSIPDSLWNKADAQNWTENAIREYVADAGMGRQNADRLTAVNLSPDLGGGEKALSTPPTAPNRPTNDGGNGGSQPPYRTSIGERMGLYDNPPAQSPPVKRYADDDEDYDEEAVDEANRLLDEFEAEERLSMTAILDEWDDPMLAAVLKLLRRLSEGQQEEKKLNVMLTELLTISREDIRRTQVNAIPVPGDFWKDRLQKTKLALNGLIAERIDQAITAYLDELYRIGQAIREDLERRR